MATREAKRKLALAASQRIDDAVTSLADLLGLALPGEGPKAKDPQLREIRRWEWLADVLEQAVATLQAATIEGTEQTAGGPWDVVERLTEAVLRDAELREALAARGLMTYRLGDDGIVAAIDWGGTSAQVQPVPGDGSEADHPSNDDAAEPESAEPDSAPSKKRKREQS
jgi:hypothetical protein